MKKEDKEAMEFAARAFANAAEGAGEKGGYIMGAITAHKQRIDRLEGLLHALHETLVGLAHSFVGETSPVEISFLTVNGAAELERAIEKLDGFLRGPLKPPPDLEKTADLVPDGACDKVKRDVGGCLTEECDTSPPEE